MKVLLVGDSHNNYNHVTEAIVAAKNFGLEKVVQVGDMTVGNEPSSQIFLEKVTEAALENKICFGFIDGNHENFDILDTVMKENPKNDEGAVWLTESILWYPRGTVVSWGNRRLAFMGGSFTINRKKLKKFVHWWPQETIKQSDIANLKNNLSNKTVDVLISHDAPGCVQFPFEVNWNWPKNLLDEATQQRALLNDAVNLARPQIVVHGHWHKKYYCRSKWGEHAFDCYGLGRENVDALAILDLENLTLSPLENYLT